MLPQIKHLNNSINSSLVEAANCRKESAEHSCTLNFVIQKVQEPSTDFSTSSCHKNKMKKGKPSSTFEKMSKFTSDMQNCLKHIPSLIEYK